MVFQNGTGSEKVRRKDNIEARVDSRSTYVTNRELKVMETQIKTKTIEA